MVGGRWVCWRVLVVEGMVGWWCCVLGWWIGWLEVVFIDLVSSQKVCFHMLGQSICDVIVSQKCTMKNKSSISLGGTTILLALFAQK